MLTKLGKYEIKGELGSGGMGVVYWGEDRRLSRPVALKTMSPEVARDPELLKRFYREAQAAAQLRHPNIVTIYDIDEAEGLPFIAMEFLEGEDLEKIICARKELPVVRKLDIVIDTCKGLHYAHQHGIVHRDVKPGNVVVLNDGQVKIVDFGIARVGVSSMTRTGIALGTVKYMSPEQLRGERVDARSDIFSLGIVLYELLTCQYPFPGREVPEIVYKLCNAPPEPIGKFLTQCPPQLEKIVLQALMKNREERYLTAADMIFEMQQVADSLRRDMVEVYLQQGQLSLQDGNLALAKESLQKVLEIDSSHELAKGLLARVQGSISARERTQRMEQLLSQAREALEAEQYEETITSLEELLRLEPAHEEAQKYKQLAVQQRDRAEKIRRHLERAEKLAGGADYQRAKAELEAVLAIDSKNSAALKMVDWVRKELVDQERLRQVRQYVQTARAHLGEKNFAKALELLAKARELDAVNVEIEAVTRLVRSAQEREERRQLLMQRLAEIEETLSREQFDQALARAEQTLQEFPDDPEVLKLHAQVVRRAEAHKKRRYVDEQLQAARKFFDRNEYSPALAVLERAIETTPDDPRLASFVKTVQEAQEQAALETLRRDAIRQANEHIRAQNFTAAIETLEKALARVGQSPDLSDLLQFAREGYGEQQRQEKVRQALSRAQGHLRNESYEEAMQVLERARGELNASEIDALLATTREQWQKFERRREEIIAHALKLLESGEAAKAVGLFEGVPKTYFRNENFQHVYSQCRRSLDRATFIRTAVEQIERSLAQEDVELAESLLEQALKPYPDEPKLLALQKRLEEEKLRLHRLHSARLIDEAEAALGHMDYIRAIELLTSVSSELAEEPELAKKAKSLLEEAQRRGSEAGVPQLDLRPPPRRPAVGPRPETVLVQPEPKRKRLVLSAALGVLVLALVSVAALLYMVGHRSAPSYVRLTAAPWAEVVSVTNAKGQSMNITGETPMRLELPPGKYVIALRNGKTTGTVTVEVAKGKEPDPVNYTFPEVKIDDLVQELLSR